jgi:hypothetical protein
LCYCWDFSGILRLKRRREYLRVDVHLRIEKSPNWKYFAVLQGAARFGSSHDRQRLCSVGSLTPKYLERSPSWNSLCHCWDFSGILRLKRRRECLRVDVHLRKLCGAAKRNTLWEGP